MEIIQLIIIYPLFFIIYLFFLDQRRMFTLNCVLDGAPPHIDRVEENHKLEFYGVLENLSQVMIRSSMIIVCNLLQNMVEKLNLKERGTILDQHMLTNLGFDGAIEVSVEVFSQLLSCHVCKLGYLLKKKNCKLGQILKVLAECYSY